MTASCETKMSGTKMIGIVCERSVELADRLDEQGYLKDDPSVKVVKVPCSGMIQPIMIETSLDSGASGVFVTGCRLGDCHYRYGNVFLRERLLGVRMPKVKPKYDKDRIQGYWLAAPEYDSWLAYIAQFHKLLQKKQQAKAS